MEIKLINNESDWIDKVISLGDSSRNTLGFLPKQAFADYAKKNRILIAIENNDLAGYLLFRQKGPQIIIVHLCVHLQYRKNGIASALVEHLHSDNKEYYSIISLSCRRDYGLDNFWRSLGFMPIAERPGRASNDHTILTTWIRKNPNIIDLFSIVPTLVEPKKKAALDTNIVIDLCNRREEVLLLTQSFMCDNLEYYIAPDVITEINKRDDPISRNRHRNFARENFTILTMLDPEAYLKVCQDLHSIKITEKTSNTGYDISHISYAIICGCQMFITQDAKWLNNSISEYIFDKYGLLIQSPSQLIKTIDEICSPTAYAPLSLAGLNLQYAEMQANDLRAVVDALYRYSEEKKKIPFRTTLQKWMIYPDKYHMLLMKSKNDPLSLITYTIDNDIQHIVSFIINEKLVKDSLQSTLVKRIAFKLIEDAKNSGVTIISIEDSGLSLSVKNALQESLFFENEGTLMRILCRKCITQSELETIPNIQNVNSLKGLIVQCKESKMLDQVRINSTIQLEKALWPLKIKASNVPCYIVPIRANYAKELFDEDLANTNISLFANEQIEPALSIENVYYKNRRKSIPHHPARILWYISYDKRLWGSKMIRACSYLDRVEVGTAKSLYRKYRRLGVLSWQDIKNITSLDELICVYKFSYTEQFLYPIAYEKLEEILGRRYTFQSFVQIDSETFDKIYEMGCGGL